MADQTETLARIEADITALRAEWRDFITAHQLKHETESSVLNAHLVDSGRMSERFVITEKKADLNDSRLDLLEDWRSELRGVFTLAKITFGTSIVGAALSIVALLGLAAGAVR